MKHKHKHCDNINEIYKQRQRKLSEDETPAIYASIAIALHEGNLQVEHIQNIFARSQELWLNEYSGDLIGMLCRCFNDTGIQLMTQNQYDYAVKKGLIEGDDEE